MQICISGLFFGVKAKLIEKYLLQIKKAIQPVVEAEFKSYFIVKNELANQKCILKRIATVKKA